ncbi:MAG TPA: ABC transporter ATP-binding protein, partial [Actinomycetota bacterium]|nr:ABC transporter ATP-binding protein [Actinomycetota bacterium]
MSKSINDKPGARATWRAIGTAMAVGFKAAPGRMVALSVIRVTTEFGGPAQAWGLKLLTDAVIRGDESAGIKAAVLVAGIQVVTDGMTWLLIGVLMGLRERVGQEMDRRLIGLAMGVPGIEHYERPQYQDELQLLRGQRSNLANIPDAAIGNIGLIIRSISTLGLLAAVHPSLALLPVFGIPAIVIGGMAERRRRKLQEAIMQRLRSVFWLYATTTERDLGKELRVFGVRRSMRRRHDTLSAEITGEVATSEVRTSALGATGWLVFALGFVAAITLVANEVRRGRATPGDLVLTISLAQQINNQLTGAVGTVSFLVRTAHVGHRYVWLSDYARNATAAVTPAVPVDPPPTLRDGITFENVSFSYPGTEVQVLGDVNLHLPAGSTVAVVGDNGAGKSTLIKLLCRFYEPSAGRIVVDGIPMTEIDPVAWRERMAAGFQDFAKFELLAQAAVGVGHLPEVEDVDAVTAALGRASAADVVEDLPSGLGTQLGRTFDGGVELSGGQWQKLALGRAMMRERPLLLVHDEPTSSLDPQTEHALFERYAGAAQRVGTEVGAITVLVSHRFSTVRMADLIIVVQDGRLVEVGSHAELVAMAGVYAELYELQ